MKLKRSIRRPEKAAEPSKTEASALSRSESRLTSQATRRPTGRRGDQGGDFARATLFLPRPTFDLLAQHRARYGLSMQQIVEDAMDDWMKRQGYPPFYPEGWSRQGRGEPA